jgi:hypothetical protein
MGAEGMNRFRIEFQIWDKDVLTPDDYLSSVTYNFAELVQRATFTGSRAKAFEEKGGKRKNKFYLKTKPNRNAKDEKMKKPSKILVSMELVPEYE